ncbi:dihydrofolate reductase [soil metagenome]
MAGRAGGAIAAGVPHITFHLARADNGVIGQGGMLPWRLPADLKRFKAQTMGKPMVMGRKTFESFPSPLPGRRHIVLTRDRAWRAEGAEVVHLLQEALAIADAQEIAVIGGAEIFAAFLDLADSVELTEVHLSPEGDATVPPFIAWRETTREDHPAEGDRPAYSFVTLARD